MFKKYLVEFIGTLLFVYIIISTQNEIAIGASLALILLVSSKISPIFLNPAVTISMLSLGKVPPNEVLPHCLAQVLGALAAVEVFKKYKI